MGWLKEKKKQQANPAIVATAPPISDHDLIGPNGMAVPSGEGLSLLIKLNLSPETYAHLSAICTGRGQSMTACLSEAIEFARDNGFL